MSQEFTQVFQSFLFATKKGWEGLAHDRLDELHRMLYDAARDSTISYQDYTKMKAAVTEADDKLELLEMR